MCISNWCRGTHARPGLCSGLPQYGAGGFIQVHSPILTSSSPFLALSLAFSLSHSTLCLKILSTRWHPYTSTGITTMRYRYFNGPYLYGKYIYEIYLYAPYFFGNLYKYIAKKQFYCSILLRLYTSTTGWSIEHKKSFYSLYCYSL